MDQQPEDRRLIESAIETHADSMYRVAFRLSGNRDQAEEIVQETFIGAWKGIYQLRDRDKLKSWLFGILRHQYYQSIEKTKRLPKLEILDDPIAPMNCNQDLQEQVQQAIAELEEEYRLPILLVSMEGWSTQEAAEFLGIPQGTVLSRLHRARQRLKATLSRQLELDIANE
jgi:RNA polymerase sigma-70 factor (ECF subfamily)